MSRSVGGHHYCDYFDSIDTEEEAVKLAQEVWFVHGFAQRSEHGYGCVAYLRLVVNENDHCS